MQLASPAELSFVVAANQTAVLSKTVELYNLGGGELTWSWSSSESWITAQRAGNSLAVSVDPSVLDVGTHQGSVTFIGNATHITSPEERYTLPVRVTVLGETAFEPPVAPSPTITLPEGSLDVLLSWPHRPEDVYYQVFASSTPYFNLADSRSLGAVGSEAEMVDGNLLWNDPGAYYYQLRATAFDGTTVDSEPFGFFQFGLEPGE
jgi:hypothetical protein